MTANENDDSTSCGGSREPTVLPARVVTGEGGGPEKTILNSPRFLADHGYRSLCAYMYPPDDAGFALLKERAVACSAELLSIPDRGIRDLSVVKRLLHVCRSEQVSIWHGHDYKSNALGLLLRRFWPMHLVTTVHGWVRFTRKTPLYYWVDRQCLKRYERVICVSDDLRQTCLSSGVPADRCLLVDNAIDIQQYRRTLDISRAKAELGLPRERFVIGAVGRLSAEKAFDLLIRVVSRLVEDGHDVELVIAGEGDERDLLEELIASQPDPTRFRLLGHRADVMQLMQAMDLFVLSSLREGLPNVLLEAMALEVPVVATRIAGVPRLVSDGENGLLVPAGDEQELYDAIRSLLSDRIQCNDYALAGRRTIEERFSFANRMQEMAGIYDELTGRDRSDAERIPCGGACD